MVQWSHQVVNAVLVLTFKRWTNVLNFRDLKSKQSHETQTFKGIFDGKNITVKSIKKTDSTYIYKLI